MKSLIASMFGREKQTLPLAEPVCNLSPFNHYHNHLDLAFSDAQQRYVGGRVPAEEFQRLETEAEKASGYSPRRVA